MVGINTNNHMETKEKTFKGEREREREAGEAKMAPRAESQTPPYPSAARISDSPCFPQYTASLRCLEENSADKSKCQEQFDVYKECKKKEREARLERNKTRSFFS